MPKFTYYISDETFLKSIQVDNKCKTIGDLKQQISKEIGIDESKFEIENIDPLKELSSFKDGHQFKIKIINPIEDLNFLFQGKSIIIEKSSKLVINQIIKKIIDKSISFSDKGISFSDKVRSSLSFYLWNIKVPRNGFHLQGVPEGVSVEIQLPENAVTISYDQKEFYFCEGETVSSIATFFQNYYGNKYQISFTLWLREEEKKAEPKSCKRRRKAVVAENTKVREALALAYQIKKGEQYDVIGKKIYKFFHINQNECGQEMDFLSTVGDAMLFIKSVKKFNIDPNEDVILLEPAGVRCHDINVQLRTLLPKGPIYFTTGKFPAGFPLPEPKTPESPADKNKAATNSPKGSGVSKSKTKVAGQAPIPKEPPLVPNEKATPGTSISDASKAKATSGSVEPGLSKAKESITKQPAGLDPPKTDEKTYNVTLPPAEKPRPTTKETPVSKSLPGGSSAAGHSPGAVSTSLPGGSQQQSKSKRKPKPKITISTTPVERSVRITFVFDESIGPKKKSFSQEIDETVTIQELKGMVVERLNLPYKIELKCKNGDDKVHLNNSDTINSILADIQQKDASGNSINVLYVNESKEPDGMIDREAKESDESKDKKPRLLIESGSLTSSEAKILFSQTLKPRNQAKGNKNNFGQSSSNVVFGKSKKKIKRKVRCDDNGNNNESIHDSQTEQEKPHKKKETTKKSNRKKFMPIISRLEETQKNLSKNQSVEDIKIEGEEEINEQKIKYNYKTNLDEEMETVELDSEATVKTFQQFIGSKYSVSDYSTIQVLFAGKVLTDNIVLENLEVGDYPLFVYIRSTGEIFLKTAKANRVEYEYEYQYEEEEEEGNE